MTLRIPRSEAEALRKAYIEHAIAAAGIAGRKLPADIRQAFKATSPTRKAYNVMVNFSPAFGHEGAFIDPEWQDPVLGPHRFTVCMGKRPHGGKAGLARINTRKPWGLGNARWVKPSEGQRDKRKITLEEVQYGTWLGRERARHVVEVLIPRARQEHGMELLSEQFLRRSSNALYPTWDKIWRRCEDPSDKDYPNYGGRGIDLYRCWMGCCDLGFEEFNYYILTTLGLKASRDLTIDRINPNGDYAPGNLRWATKSEQTENRRTIIEPGMTEGEKLAALAAEAGRGVDRRADKAWALALEAGIATVEEGSTWEIGEDAFPKRLSGDATRDGAGGQP